MSAKTTPTPVGRTPEYGGRGITFCERWRTFAGFFADMGPRPSPKHSIDRINNNGNYEPGNCRWATQREQCLNKSKNAMFSFDGKTQCISAWASDYHIDYGTLRGRLIKLGWSIERAVLTPVRKLKKWRTSPPKRVRPC